MTRTAGTNSVPKTAMLVMLFILSSWMPMISYPLEEKLEDVTDSSPSSPFTTVSGSSHDFAGFTLNFDGLENATVRQESMLDLWESEVVMNSSGEHFGVPDLKLTRSTREHYCWTTLEGPVRTAIHTSGGAWETTLVDTVSTSTVENLVNCAIAVTENELQRVMYADGDNLKIGRFAKINEVYFDAPRWHNRTIIENFYPTDIELSLMPSGTEWAAVRTDDGRLHQVNFTGTYWTTYLLDEGPIGHDFELQIDEDGIVHLVYTRTTSGEVVLLRLDGFERDTRILSRDSSIGDGVGMGLDSNDIEQVATFTQGATSFEVQLIRSLFGQDTGRINTVDTGVIDGELDVVEGSMMAGDLNGDDFDDVVISSPFSSVNGLSMNGRVDIFYGHPDGLSPTSDLTLSGAMNGERFGSALDIGDFNGDGIQDLAVSAPRAFKGNDSGNLSGVVHIFAGSIAGLSTTSWWSVEGNGEEQMGSVLTALKRDGLGDVLVISTPMWSQQIDASTTHTGKVNVYLGNETTMTLQRNLTQSLIGGTFGQSLEGCDIDGDGNDDLIVGNTGTYASAAFFSSIEYFRGSDVGLNGTPDHRIQSNQNNRLFGHTTFCVGDLDLDGDEEHIITEPFNSSAGIGSGKLWLFEGDEFNALDVIPEWTMTGTAGNRIGLNVVQAGDVNEDGYPDLLFARNGTANAGTVELFLGSPSGMSSNGELIAQGGNGEFVGQLMVAKMDLDGDGLGEVVYSHRDFSLGNDYGIEYVILTEQDWESLSFTFDGTLIDLELGTADRGETSIMLGFEDAGERHMTRLEHTGDGTPSGQWVEYAISSTISNTTHFAYAVHPSGSPIVAECNNESLIVRHVRGMTSVEKSLVTSGTMGQHLGAALDENGQDMLAYTSGTGQQLFFSQETTSGWIHEFVRGGVDLDGDVAVAPESSVPHLVYRLASTNQLELATRDGSWNLISLGEAGDALSSSHPIVFDENGNLTIALIDSDGIGSNLSVWNYDGTMVNRTSIANLSDLSAQLELVKLENGSLLLASLTSTGSLDLYERYPGQTSWVNHALPQPTGTMNQFRIDLVGDSHPALAVRGNSLTTILGVNESGDWVDLAQRPSGDYEGAWELIHTGTHLVMLTSSETDQRLTFNSYELNEVDEISPVWMSLSFGDISDLDSVHAFLDENHTIHLAMWDTLTDDVDLLRLYLDSDRDLVFDLVDDFDLIGNQWLDLDGDNYGENPLGPLADACQNEQGTSSYYTYGCEDFDADGFADIIDGCDDVSGNSYIDRRGCIDYDQDGWSDNSATYYDGDEFELSWKQARDSDGDGYGDNHGPDCCNTEIDNQEGDLFPHYASQYKDTDGDGFGDNETDLEFGDWCPFVWGGSWRDRNGCLDSDGDGASDPSDFGTFFEWNIEDGADMWPNDPTQWADSDGDGFGDNSSVNATNPDHFPNNIAAANDSDLDGFPDNWTANYTGNNSLGLVIDGCPNLWGNSTREKAGCLDQDGDSWRDSDDAFPLQPTQWSDLDGDGFGDNPNGFQADECPNEFGVLDGTNGIGCRFIDINDDDDDGVMNDDDACINTPSGEVVNDFGCSQSQLDDDNDGVMNNVDRCPGTSIADSADTEGCSETQRSADTDGDGVGDPDDACPGTPAQSEVDASGCALTQRDSDGDGVTDDSDECPDTPEGFPSEAITSTGCIDESKLDIDLDGDGYAGIYTYEIDEQTGLRVNQSGDLFPGDATQWFDTDGDGFGDNWGNASWNSSLDIDAFVGEFIPNAKKADACPTVNGTSYLIFPGCEDDGDGYWDEREDFPGDATQWIDSDLDGFGDNWGDSSWNSVRLDDGFGEFVSGALKADLCPNTPIAYRFQVDVDGCHPTERDSDLDGITDDKDQCPTLPKGVDGTFDGCPVVTNGAEDEPLMLFGMSLGMAIGAIGGGILGLVLVVVVISKLISRDEDEEEDDGFDDDDEDEDDVFSNLDRRSKQRNAPAGRTNPSRTSPRGPQRSSDAPRPSPASPSRSPAQHAEPSRGPGASAPKSNGPPGRNSSNSTPSRGPPGQPANNQPTSTNRGPPGAANRGPPGAANRGPPGEAQPTPTVAKKRSVSQHDEVEQSGTKVRKAKIPVDLSIFESWQASDRASAVEWVISAMAEGEPERSILMQLQETGWSAEQSRAIINLARNA